MSELTIEKLKFISKKLKTDAKTIHKDFFEIAPGWAKDIDIAIDALESSRPINEVWKSIFRKYVACYNAINLLAHEGILDEEEKAVHEHNLLFEIIETMRSETEEQSID